MRRLVSVYASAVLVSVSLAGAHVAAQTTTTVPLVVASGRALRVALTEDTTVHHVGQIITARLVDPVYAYDRLVLPAGSLVQGRITALVGPSKLSRVRSMSAGDFSPPRQVQLAFDAISVEGRSITIDTIAKNETPRPQRAAV